MKKLLATVVALSCATVMLLGTAFAGAFTDGIGDGQVEAGEAWTYEIPTDSVANLDQTASVRITFTASSLEAGFGGGFIFNTSGAGAAGNNWNSKEWGNADAAKEISAVETGNDLEFTITRDDAAGLFGTTEDQYGVYNKVCLQSWWGADINVTKLELLDASGNTIYSAPAGGNSEETVLGSVENPANGTITILNGYTFTEEDIVVRIYISTVDDDHSGWGFGALCSSDWKNIVKLPAGTSAELKVVEMTLKELGDAFTAAGYAATDGVVLNDWDDYASVAKIEVVRLAVDDPEDPTPSVTPDDPEDPDPTETPEDPTPTPGTGTEDTPKTGDTMSWVLFAALAVVTLGGVIVSKKARA